MFTLRVSFFLLTIFYAADIYAQNSFPIPGGNVGIGLPQGTSAVTPLQVGGEINTTTSNYIAFSTKSELGVAIQQVNLQNDFVNSNSYISVFAHNAYHNGTNWIRRNSYSGMWATSLNNMYYDISYSPAAGDGIFNVIVNPVSYFNITSSGNVGIGTSTPKAKLAVNGDILTKKVTVSMNNLPDYVFLPDYKLLALDSVNSYIRANHHLPDMPSADSVAKSGLDLGDNQAVLLKKVEELTLYVIQQQQEISELKAENRRINAKLDIAAPPHKKGRQKN